MWAGLAGFVVAADAMALGTAPDFFAAFTALASTRTPWPAPGFIAWVAEAWAAERFNTCDGFCASFADAGLRAGLLACVRAPPLCATPLCAVWPVAARARTEARSAFAATCL